jgi:molecular chaperone GrpE
MISGMNEGHSRQLVSGSISLVSGGQENSGTTTMGDTPQDDSARREGAPSAGATTAGGDPGTAAQQGGAEPAQRTPHDVIVALQAEAADLKDRLLRAHAEVENIRKRSEREKEETAKYAVTKFARDIVNVGDNFQRAIDTVPAGAAEQDPALKSFLDGVTMTERELLNVLERYGIKRVQPTNEPFNPHLHQAVMEIQRSDVPSGTVVQVFQAGFMIEDRVLRPAMVAVSKGGPKPAPTPEGTATPGASAPSANENPQPG